MKKKLLLLITEDKWFLTHRLPLAKEAGAQGFDIVVVTCITKYKSDIESLGYRVVPLKISRGGTQPIDELRSMMALMSIYRHEKPDIVHHIGIKNILYGTFSAKRVGVKCVVNAFSGLGFLYTANHWKARLLRPLLNMVLKYLHAQDGVRVVFQNPDDMALMQRMGIVGTDQAVLIRGSGVDLERFVPAPEPEGDIRCVMAGRLLWAKGLGILAEAGRILKDRNLNVRLQLVGEPDFQNPSSVDERQLREWESAGLVEWLGYSENMPAVWLSANIGILPTFYGEGVPKVLLEAAASGRPLIATDAPGCREIVEQGENGFLVPVKDPQALADAIQMLAENPILRKRMGEKSRQIVEQHFSGKQVALSTVEVYQQLLASE